MSKTEKKCIVANLTILLSLQTFFFHSLTVSSIDPNLKITFIILSTILIEVVTQALCIHLCEATLQQGSQEQG